MKSAAMWLGVRASSDTELMDKLKKGLGLGNMLLILLHLGFTEEDCKALKLPSPASVRQRESKRLTPEESDRLYRIAHAAARATLKIGSPAKGRGWLLAPHESLGDSRPIDWLDTYPGTSMIHALIDDLRA